MFGLPTFLVLTEKLFLGAKCKGCFHLIHFLKGFYQVLIQVDKLDYFKITTGPQKHFRNYFCFLGFYEYLERLEGKIKKCLFF